MKKILLVLGIIVVLAGIVGFAYWYWQNQQDVTHNADGDTSQIAQNNQSVFTEKDREIRLEVMDCDKKNRCSLSVNFCDASTSLGLSTDTEFDLTEYNQQFVQTQRSVEEKETCDVTCIGPNCPDCIPYQVSTIKDIQLDDVARCVQDSDCQLVSYHFGVTCMSQIQSCGSIDMSREDWIAINEEKLDDIANNECGDKVCDICPNAEPTIINNAFEAKCIENRCQKIGADN